MGIVEHDIVGDVQALVPGIERVEGETRHGGRTRVFTCWTDSPLAAPIVVKNERGAPVHDLFVAHGEYARVLADEPHVSSPEPIAWQADPPLFAMSFQHGSALADTLPAAVATRSVESFARAREAIRLAGHALGRLHLDLDAGPPSGRDAPHAAERLYRTHLEPTSADGLRVRRISDFAVYNMLYDAVGQQLSLFDLPPLRESTHPYDDVGYFLMTLMNATVGVAAVPRRATGWRLFRVLEEEFLDEYARVMPVDVAGASDRRAIGLLTGFHAFNWGRRRMRAPHFWMLGLHAMGCSAATRLSAPWPWMSARNPTAVNLA